MRKLLLFTALIAVSFASFAQVGIGTTTPNTSAALDVTSTTQGFLPPCMTQTQRNAINKPAAGLMVYCTDCGAKGEMQHFNGAAWVNMVGATAALLSTDVYSTTGQTWMDRNLGATQVATSSTDAASYGNHYQWGKKQEFGASITTSAGPVADATAAGTNFITNSTAPFDWRNPQDDSLWNSGSVGAPVKVTANDPCPTGYRIPTDAELDAERVEFATQDAAGAWGSVLKLPVAGYRGMSTGALADVGSWGYYWSSTDSSTTARYLFFISNSAFMDASSRGNGFSVRCIKE